MSVRRKTPFCGAIARVFSFEKIVGVNRSRGVCSPRTSRSIGCACGLFRKSGKGRSGQDCRRQRTKSARDDSWRAQKRGAGRRVPANRKIRWRMNAASGYCSFFTASFTVAVISLWSLIAISYSPTTLIGSASVIFFLSSVKPCAASASEMSAVVTEPKS
jgi:hypothetical protein